MFRKTLLVLSVSAVLFLSSCAAGTIHADSIQGAEMAASSADEADAEHEMPVLDGEPAMPDDLIPSASGIKVCKNERAEIDYSNAADGYVMVRFTGESDKKLKAQVIGPTTTYTYNLTPGDAWTTFSLSDGDGDYKIVVYENTTDAKYATVLAETISVELADEFAPFLCSNQYVDYVDAPRTVQKARELTGNKKQTLEKVAAVYDYVISNMSYDYELASTVKSGYLPVLDTVLASKKGICFDYAALMTGMLRSQRIPCKLVVGYAGSVYHAWISVWTAENGWIDGAVYFDGTSWTRMDPTFADTGENSKEIVEYIHNDDNYTIKYLY